MQGGSGKKHPSAGMHPQESPGLTYWIYRFCSHLSPRTLVRTLLHEKHRWAIVIPRL